MQIKRASLPKDILDVVLNKGTEAPFSGVYADFDGSGTYLCRQCGTALFRSEKKFHSGCGWPSFDQELPGSVLREPDADGRRTEILCSNCRAHLGHVFQGEGFTPLNTRHCVNSVSLDFVPNQSILKTEEGIFAAGCFWGVEHYFRELPGVLKTEVGYTGGKTEYPTYESVCSKNTGHLEAVRVVYDPAQLSFRELAQYFFEIHDPTQSNGQGPDLGEQYLSAIFYYDQSQKEIAEDLIKILKKKGLEIQTSLRAVEVFYPAELYHQDYYAKKGGTPYCHRYVKRF